MERPFVVLLLFSSAVHFSKAASAAYEAADGSGGLTEAEFAAGDLINDEELVRMYPGFGGPKMAPRDSEAGNFSIPKGGVRLLIIKLTQHRLTYSNHEIYDGS